MDLEKWFKTAVNINKHTTGEVRPIDRDELKEWRDKTRARAEEICKTLQFLCKYGFKVYSCETRDDEAIMRGDLWGMEEQFVVITNLKKGISYRLVVTPACMDCGWLCFSKELRVLMGVHKPTARVLYKDYRDLLYAIAEVAL